jgi:hypothetical protein
MLERRRKFWKSASFLCCVSTTLQNKGEHFLNFILKKYAMIQYILSSCADPKHDKSSAGISGVALTSHCLQQSSET